MATKIQNTRKGFNWLLQINGVNQFEMQKCTIPDIEIEVSEHGDTNKKVKTAGMVKIGTIELEKLKPLPTTDRFAFDWLMRAQNSSTGSGELAQNYKEIVVIVELHPDNFTPVNRWFCEGVWPSKISQTNFDRTSSDAVMQKVTLQVDDIDLLD